MSATIDKIAKILIEEFSVVNYMELMTEILDGLQIVAPNNPKEERSNFSSYIVGYTHVGNYTSPDKKKIIVMAVELKNQTYVENSRSTQRSYAKKLMGSVGADAALIAFYTQGIGNWRFSFVRLDHEFKFINGKSKLEENLTPARRYSFLVGKDEPCHTAIERFRLLIDKNATRPTLDEIENAFSVESVTNEFFELYCEKFLQLRDYLEKNDVFVEEARLHNFTSAQFAKKLMGQIVFLYFLQKKGWLGVKAWQSSLNEREYKYAFFAKGSKSRELIPKVYLPGEDGLYHLSKRGLDELDNADEEILAGCVKGEPWGSGPYNFMRRLYELSAKENANFFDDYLEPLFYNALNINRGEQGYDSALHCRIPFLSGGLFEPIDGYDWQHNNFDIPNELFSNKNNDKDRLADGILDIFDRYNFTMSEDEPLEREVAIDPEMLGKVFENLLDVNDRKSKGAFYTPREIVHYMCQESLINYLKNAMQVKESAIRDFILYGDFMKDEDASVLRRAEKGDTYELWISEELFELNTDGMIKTNRIQEIDKALQDVRVADPAVGSGAFPLGMLNEIVRTRQNLTTYMDIVLKIMDPKGASREIRYRRINDRSAWQLKYDTIRNSIFAVDIEPSAVDIAQLRLWLALVIDDEIDPNALTALDGHRNPLPLPNLECNILCGNSLIDEFEGIKLINDSELIGNTPDGQVDIYRSGFNATLERFITKQQQLFRCDNTDTKVRLLEEIADLRNSVIMTQLERAKPDILGKYEATKTMASKPYVLWQLDFAKVFQEKGGFDIVIGNPPYIDSETMTKLMPMDREKYVTIYSSAKGNWDFFVLFIEKGIKLANRNGIQTYIVPNKLVSAPYASTIKKCMSQYCINEIRDYSNVNVFKAAAVYPVVYRLSIGQKKGSVSMDVMSDFNIVDHHALITAEQFYSDIDWDKYFGSNSQILAIIEKLNRNPKLAEIATVNGAATVNEAYIVKEFITDCAEYDSSMKKFTNTGTIDPYYTYWGKDYTRYLKDKYLFPVVDRESLAGMSPKRLAESDAEKIIIGGMTKVLECYYDQGQFLAGKSTTIVYNSKYLKYLLGVLNSNLMNFYYSRVYNSMSLAGGFFRIGAPQVKNLPIAIPNDNLIIDKIEKLVMEIQEKISQYNQETEEIQVLKKDVDILVYRAYSLTTDEVSAIANE